MKLRGMVLKSLLLIALSFISFSTYALYIGNPHRPNTTWVPGHYENGCWVEGYYLKFMNAPVRPTEVVWVEPYQGRQGHWMPVNGYLVNDNM